MKKSDWTVGQEGIRSDPSRCHYCRREIGSQHASDCVVRCRTVVIKLSIELVVPEPECFDAHHIEFRYNEGSYCMSNMEGVISNLVGRITPKGKCMCNLDHDENIKVEYLREATADDEEMQELYAEDLKG